MARSATHYRITLDELASGLCHSHHVAKRIDAAQLRAYSAAYQAAGLDAARDTARGHKLCRTAAAWDGVATMILDFAGMRLTFEPYPA